MIEMSLFSPLTWLRPSHRGRAEQIVGLSIFAVLAFGVESLGAFLAEAAFSVNWYTRLTQAPWALAQWTYGPIWTIFYILLTLSMWTLWRRHSLRVLKPELSLFLTQFALQIAWFASFFVLQETLLSLMALALLWFSTILSGVIFWRKDRLAGQLMLFPFFWTTYLMSLNMMICVANPG